MSVERTTSLAEAIEWEHELHAGRGPVGYFLDPDRFVALERCGGTLWLTLEGDEPFGVATGPHATPRDEWGECLIDGAFVGSAPVTRVGGWDLFDRATVATGSPATATNDLDEVQRLLEGAAPTSSVWPGDPSVVAWYGEVDDDRLVAVAALTRWGSGRHIIASVATAPDSRRRGHARRLVAGVLADAHRRGLPEVALGVGLENAGARQLYLDLGFVHRARLVRWRRLPLGT